MTVLLPGLVGGLKFCLFGYVFFNKGVLLVASVQETRLGSLGLEDTLEKGMATHSRILV